LLGRATPLKFKRFSRRPPAPVEEVKVPLSAMRLLHSGMTVRRIAAEAGREHIASRTNDRTKGTDMNKLISKMHDAARARVAYRRTLSELRSMPIDVALDLDIDRANAARIAYKAVYGQ
jgi:hypothetical protein